MKVQRIISWVLIGVAVYRLVKEIKNIIREAPEIRAKLAEEAKVVKEKATLTAEETTTSFIYSP